MFDSSTLVQLLSQSMIVEAQGRICVPKEVSAAVIVLASVDASFIIGNALYADTADTRKDNVDSPAELVRTPMAISLGRHPRASGDLEATRTRPFPDSRLRGNDVFLVK